MVAGIGFNTVTLVRFEQPQKALSLMLVTLLGISMLVKPALKKTLKGFDTSEYGGAPMLGLNGLVVKIHGNSTSVETRNALAQCIAFVKEDIEGKIRLHLAAKTATE